VIELEGASGLAGASELAAATAIDVYAVDGRLVRRLAAAGLRHAAAAGRHRVTWDGRDAAGRRVAAGSYFIVVRTPSSSSVARVVRLP
jgi:flagellar hook assembly protein FlgD